MPILCPGDLVLVIPVITVLKLKQTMSRFLSSNNPCTNTVGICQNTDLLANTIPEAPDGKLSLEKVRELQKSDSIIGKIITWKDNNERPDWSDISQLSPNCKHYWARWNSLYMRSDVLYRKWESIDGANVQ